MVDNQIKVRILADIKTLDPEFPILQIKLDGNWVDYGTVREDDIPAAVNLVFKGHPVPPHEEFRVIGEVRSESGRPYRKVITKESTYLED